MRGAWGIVDLDDCTNAALWLAEQGLVDRRRLAIRGGSAGGYTTLCALVFRDVFACGTSFYGVGDLEALARDTHKFESRYLDLLLAPYPDEVEVYRERSPIHHLDGLSCPVLLLQGEDDEVVPPAQAEEVAAVLREKGIPFAYLLFAGEGHGFRGGGRPASVHGGGAVVLRAGPRLHPGRCHRAGGPGGAGDLGRGVQRGRSRPPPCRCGGHCGEGPSILADERLRGEPLPMPAANPSPLTSTSAARGSASGGKTIDPFMRQTLPKSDCLR